MWRLYIPALIINLSLMLSCFAAGSKSETSNQLDTQNRIRSDYVIGSFNIQSFGKYKIAQKDIRPYLSKILKRYDIMLVQEIRDKSETAIYTLLEDLREVTGKNYKIKLSERLGSGSHKEQLAYIYDASIFSITIASSPKDENDIFYREPYIVNVRNNETTDEFIIIGAHLSPKYVIEEVEGIADVVEQAYEQLNNKKIMVIGDLNASCDYITKSDLANNSLRTSEYTWWIEDDADTTATYGTNCAYDRIITTSQMNEFISSDARIYNFQKSLRLSKEKTLRISDHYPVEISISF
jgi:endonuclease/exonuclease/phosphatase family metal-dependent hydrolase